MEIETTAVQSSLLLRCGDVESNPGPLSREGNFITNDQKYVFIPYSGNLLRKKTCAKNGISNSKIRVLLTQSPTFH